jgi:pimeloyl-ACP methyl ester carboxylesterase
MRGNPPSVGRRHFVRNSFGTILGLSAAASVSVGARDPERFLLAANQERSTTPMTVNHRTVETNGIRMHIAEQGQGPLVILCHGFPELWYSWRHQLSALAAAGFHAVAPDQRGYGDTSRPQEIDAYTLLDLTADIAGLVHPLGESNAIVVGHDWGAPVAWHCALLRPDIFRAVGLLSVPYVSRAWNAPRPTDFMKRIAGEKQFYQLYFQEPGKAEAELEADVRRSILKILYAASGSASPDKRWRFMFEKGEKFIDTIPMPEVLLEWLTEADLDVYERAFRQSGFRGGLNWYRNMDRNWERSAFLSGSLLRQPTLFVAGENDAVIAMMRPVYEALGKTVPNLRKRVLIPGAGHWIQQERPEEVNELLLEFVKSV